jgi:hypothetical protein
MEASGKNANMYKIVVLGEGKFECETQLYGNSESWQIFNHPKVLQK